MEHQNHHKVAIYKKVLSALRVYSAPLAIIFVGALISGAVLLKHNLAPKNSNSSGKQVAAQDGAGAKKEPAKPADISKINTKGVPFIGNKDAPVVIAYWFDYQCPFCKKVESEVFPELLKEYVETGKVKVVFKGFPVLGSDSQSAALAERGIWELNPEKFFGWHLGMFAKQDEENKGWGNRQDIIALMKEVGIDSDAADKLIQQKAPEYQKVLVADMDEGAAYGVTGTPGFIIGKQLIVGSVPYATIKDAVDKVLQAK